MVHDLMLGAHIAAGVAGLILGPLAIGRGRRPLAAYQLAVVVVAVTALALTAMDWSGLWPFSLLALGTGAAVIGGWWQARHRRAGWQTRFVRLTGGSYISLVTALLVVSWPSVAAWLVPTLVGVPLVERAAARQHRLLAEA